MNIKSKSKPSVKRKKEINEQKSINFFKENMEKISKVKRWCFGKTSNIDTLGWKGKKRERIQIIIITMEKEVVDTLTTNIKW